MLRKYEDSVIVIDLSYYFSNNYVDGNHFRACVSLLIFLPQVNDASGFYTSPSVYINTTEWSHITLSWDPALPDVIMWINGEMIGRSERIDPSYLIVIYDTIRLGDNLDAVPASASADMLIDEVYLFERQLTDIEIKSKYGIVFYRNNY